MHREGFSLLNSAAKVGRNIDLQEVNVNGIMNALKCFKCQTDLFSSVIVSLNQPANRRLRRLGKTLQKSGVVFYAVLCHLHCVPVG